ncbi:MAG: hypothetical protein P8Y53_23535 [Pseudolabrys sp.]
MTTRPRSAAGRPPNSRPLGRRGKMQIGEQEMVPAQQLELGRLRLLDLDDQLGAIVQRLGIGQHLHADALILRIVVTARKTGTRFDEDLVAVLHQIGRRGRHQGDASLQDLDLARDADAHEPSFTLPVALRTIAALR